MVLSVKLIKNRYIDSVSLMALSTKANQVKGINEVIIAMATDMNKEVMANVNLFNEEIAAAQSSDLVIVFDFEEGAVTEEIYDEIEALMNEKKTINQEEASQVFKTIATAKEQLPAANLALISVNGDFAVREAYQALDNDLNVMMFSDNVPFSDEIALKEVAHKKGLLMMGPDCGTAIINNVGLGFANQVRPGNIGIIGASGTGSQEISVRIHEFGGGISQLIGTGGRDLSEEVGGRMMLDGMAMLEEDEETKVIVLISKPPAKAVEVKIVAQAAKLSKPVVLWFVGDQRVGQESNLYFEKMSKNAALKAVELAGVDLAKVDLHPLNQPLITEVSAKLGSEPKYIRGLFAGGTLCAEAFYIAKEKLTDVFSNVSHEPDEQLNLGEEQPSHRFIDFGADEYTNGKPHPMIDPSNRLAAFEEEAQNPNVGVILLDFVLGYGAHADPVGTMVEKIKQAKTAARQAGRELIILGYVLGTDLDEQHLSQQIEKLTEAGGIYASSSQNAGLLAREFVLGGVHYE